MRKKNLVVESSPEERREMLEKMQQISNTFYSLSVQVGVHAWIEFCGLMNEYVTLCQAAHAQGIDFGQANTHSGAALPVKPHNAAYLAEKLNCIYGPSLLSDPEVRGSFIDVLFDGRFKLVPA
jgi:hypothetical protein